MAGWAPRGGGDIAGVGPAGRSHRNHWTSPRLDWKAPAGAGAGVSQAFRRSLGRMEVSRSGLSRARGTSVGSGRLAALAGDATPTRPGSDIMDEADAESPR